jgi:hypothetical protein
MVPTDPMDRKDPKARKARKDQMGLKAQKDPMGHGGRKDRRDPTDRKARKDPRGRSRPGYLWGPYRSSPVETRRAHRYRFGW